jgi:menaquinone-dependent protoporphyrinogen oxidase
MDILITYATKHGATQQIAERIAETLHARGLATDVRPVKPAGDLAPYDAFVIGSAVYFGSWLKEAATFVRQNQAVLAGRPVWLFSSGPLGTSATDAAGHDLREAALPKEAAEFRESIKPREHQVFFGLLDHQRFGFTERLMWALPASRSLLLEGDFRDWPAIEAFAERIAHDLVAAPATRA